MGVRSPWWPPVRVRRPRPRIGVGTLLVLSIGALLATLLAILTGGGYVLLDEQQAHDERVDAALVQGVRAELRAGYAELERFLEEREHLYRRAHERARQTIQERGLKEADLDALAGWLSEEFGHAVHLYIIAPDLHITRTTFEPDQGLDFTMEGMGDARSMLEKALSEDEILIGPPTLELVSREFRFYTYGPLNEDGYALELGFSPPAIGRVFRDMEQRMADRALYDGELFFLVNDRWLIPLGSDLEMEGTDKEEAFAQISESRGEQYRHFQRAAEQRGLYRPDSTSEPAAYYAWLNRIDLGEAGHHLDVLARLDMQHPGSDEVRRIWLAVLAAIGVLIVLATGLFHLVARRLLIVPLRQVAQLAAARQPVPLYGPIRWVRELRLLAWQVNRGMAHSRRQIQALDRQAHYDCLTGLLNRSGLDQQLATQVTHHLESGRPLALLLIDLDHFKRVNDEQGHTVGDEILQHFAGLLRTSVREADIVGRWGGEEFIVLLPATDEAGAMRTAEKLRQAVSGQPVLYQYGLTASLGVSVLRSEDDGYRLFERADRALYAAKDQGRDRVYILRRESDEPSEGGGVSC